MLMSMNDHGWGPRPDPGGNNRGGNQGPPDLDELWRDVNRRLSSFFGKKGGGQGGNPVPPPLDARQFGGGIAMLVVLALAMWLGSGVYLVDEG